MHDAKKINAIVSDIASRGGASNKSPTPTANFGQRMAAAKKTPRAASHPTRGVSSNAPPNPVNVEKGYKPTAMKQAKTKIPKPSMKGTPAPGMGKAKGGHAAKGASIVHNHYYGANDGDGDE